MKIIDPSDYVVLTSSDMSSMTFENEVEYYFQMDSSVTAADIRSFATKINTAITNGITIGNSTIDLSNTTVTSIDAFSVSPKITKLILPAGVQNLAGQTFQESPDLEEIVLPGGSNNKYLVEDGILYDKDKTTLVYYPAAKAGDTYTLPETVTKLQMEAFQSNKNLVTINGLNRIQNLLHDGIFNSAQKLEVVDFSGLTCTNLRGWTFVGSHIKKIIVSSSINTFGSSCFNSGLEEIHFLGTTPPATTGSFVPASTIIYVPTGYKTVYEEWVAEHSQSNTVYEE
ncbi:MAG: leucine-rich repeat domain-containing protein [Treponema sp.]|nr:leucine-rich repeat domain-containing protein [Treponema sp.]